MNNLDKKNIIENLAKNMANEEASKIESLGKAMLHREKWKTFIPKATLLLEPILNEFIEKNKTKYDIEKSAIQLYLKISQASNNIDTEIFQLEYDNLSKAIIDNKSNRNIADAGEPFYGSKEIAKAIGNNSGYIYESMTIGYKFIEDISCIYNYEIYRLDSRDDFYNSDVYKNCKKPRKDHPSRLSQ